MNLKRALLLRLARKNTELYPTDAVKREKVYSKYKVIMEDTFVTASRTDI